MLRQILQAVHRLSAQTPEPQRLPRDVERVMRTRYKIDSYQQTYFVINSFQELFNKTAPDFTPIYERVKVKEELAAGCGGGSLNNHCGLSWLVMPDPGSSPGQARSGIHAAYRSSRSRFSTRRMEWAKLAMTAAQN